MRRGQALPGATTNIQKVHVMFRTPARFRLPLLLLAAFALAGCPTGNGDENEDPAGEGPPDASDPPQPVTTGGTASGLGGGELKMRGDFASDSDSGHQQLLLTSDEAVDRGNRCRGGRGHGRGVPAGPGQAECATVTYTVDGLLGAGLIVGLVSEVVINGNVEFIVVEEDHIGEDGEYTFDTWLAPGEPYKVKVVQIPVDPDQFCPVKNAEGSVAGDVTDVEIVCGGPVRTWRFDDTTTLPDTDEATLDTHEPLAGDVLFRGVLSEEYKFQEGPAIPLGLLADLDVTELFKTYLDRPGGDGVIFSNLSGKTYWLAVESPQLNFDNPSHHARLDTEWRLRKESESSDFKLTVTHVNMLAYNDVYSRANAFGGFL
jgi:hypothetical protein